EKKKKIDSLQVVFDSAVKAQAAQMPPGARMPTTEIVFPALDKLPDYHPPIRPVSGRADADGNLWILPTTSTQAGGPPYDVVNREGKLYQRVQIPPQSSIAGFAKGGVVYIYRFTDATGVKATLERATVSLTRSVQ